jgi:hypothetical protein
MARGLCVDASENGAREVAVTGQSRHPVQDQGRAIPKLSLNIKRRTNAPSV